MSLEYLRRNNLIRQYLHRFDERQWPEVVKLTVIFGIHSMKLNEHEKQFLTIEKLSHLCAQASTATSIHETLPTLEHTLEELQSKISTLKNELENDISNRSESTQNLQVDVDGAIASLKDQNARTACKFFPNANHVKKPCHEARSQYSRQTVRGLQDDTGSVPKALSAFVPQISRSSKPSKPKWKERPPPRLAYSVCQNNNLPNTMDNDVVSSRYIDVPATSRDLRKASSHSDVHGEDQVPVKENSASIANVKRNRTRTSGLKPKMPSYLQNVRSRIKERVHQDRLAAAEHRRNFRKSIQQAILDDYPPKFPEPSPTRRQTERSSVLTISDAFLKNPLMKPFTGFSKDHDEMSVFSQPNRTDRSSCEIRSAPGSTDKLASLLRGWVNSNDDDDDGLRPGLSSVQPPSDDVLTSLRRLNGESVRSVRFGQDAPGFESVLKGPELPEWDFSNTVFD